MLIFSCVSSLMPRETVAAEMGRGSYFSPYTVLLPPASSPSGKREHSWWSSREADLVPFLSFLGDVLLLANPAISGNWGVTELYNKKKGITKSNQVCLDEKTAQSCPSPQMIIRLKLGRS